MQTGNGCELEFLKCPFRGTDRCRPDDEIPDCVYGLTKARDEDGDLYISEHTLELVKRWTYDNGCHIHGIEDYILRLNNVFDTMVEHDGRETEGLKKFTETFRYEPFIVPRKNEYQSCHLRASEFSGGKFEKVTDMKKPSKGKCDLTRIFTKVDQEELGHKQSASAETGTGNHAFTNGQHKEDMLENSRLKLIGMKPVDRRKYGETPVELMLELGGKRYVISGHPDAILQCVNRETGETEPAIFDLKSKKYSMYEDWGTKFQMTVYALAVIQQLDMDCEQFQVISAKRPRYAHPGNYREMELHITRLRRDGDAMDRLLLEAERTATVQRMILDDRSFHKNVKDKMLAAKKCDSCFSGEICLDADRDLFGNEMTLRELLSDKWKALKKGVSLP